MSVLSILLLTFQLSCKDELAEVQNEESLKGEINNSLSARTFSGDSLLLANPYTTENMTIALNKLKRRNANYQFGDFNIQTSHLYLKFTPQNENEVGLLKRDSTIHYFDYRLDAEYRDGFLESRNPDNDTITVYYTAVPIGKVLPAVNYEILSELYIPEQDSYFNNINDITDYQVTGIIQNTTDLFNNLLLTAYELTGNESELLTEDSTPTAKWIFGSKWYPSGSIRVQDDISGNVPVIGAQVLMRQWFTVAQGITDGNGNFSTSSVRGKAKYVVQWERYHYSVRDGLFFQAEMKGPNVKKESWHPLINGGEDEYHALIHQAAHDYYYGSRFGLTSPPKNNHFYLSGIQAQMKIAAREVYGNGFTGVYSHAANDFTFGLYPQIRLRMWGRQSDEVYGTTIHELTHATHSIVDRSSYDFIVQKGVTQPFVPSNIRNSSRRLLESWPTTVEILMTLERYKHIRGYFVYDSAGHVNKQLLTINAENQYTSGGYDMIDNVNQRGLYSNSALPIDWVTGYTAPQLEQSLHGTTSWNGWKTKIKNNYTNPTSINLDELFNNWQD